MKKENPIVKILTQKAKILTPCDGMQALRDIERAGRNCYRSEDRISTDSAPRFVRSLIRRGHLSPLEFADMTVE